MGVVVVVGEQDVWLVSYYDEKNFGRRYNNWCMLGEFVLLLVSVGSWGIWECDVELVIKYVVVDSDFVGVY